MIKNKLAGLQVARALAALSVVIFHGQLVLNRFEEGSYFKLTYFYKHGDIGVPFFFVISGFIISYVLARAGDFSVLEFTIKRVWRLWPTYLFCTLLYITITLLHRNLTAESLNFDISYVLQSLVFWPLQKLPALSPGWSLEHEVIFYIFMALFAKMCGVRRTFYVLFGVVLISIVYRVVLPAVYEHKVVWDYHLLASINICFLFGVGLYLFWAKYGALNKKNFISDYSKHCLWLGGASLIIAPYAIEAMPVLLENSVADRNLRKGFARFAIESAASAIFLYGLLGVTFTSYFGKLMVSIGDRSYSLYLCHFILIPVFQNIHRDHINWPDNFGEIVAVLFVLTSVLFAYILYWAIERPSSNYGTSLAKKISNRRIG